jgi:hypothetical protein
MVCVSQQRCQDGLRKKTQILNCCAAEDLGFEKLTSPSNCKIQ